MAATSQLAVTSHSTCLRSLQSILYPSPNPGKTVTVSTGTQSITSVSIFPVQADLGNRCSNNNTHSQLTDHTPHKKSLISQLKSSVSELKSSVSELKSSVSQLANRTTHKTSSRNSSKSQQNYKVPHSSLNKDCQSAKKKRRSKSATEISSDHLYAADHGRLTGELIDETRQGSEQSSKAPSHSQSDQVQKKNIVQRPLTPRNLWLKQNIKQQPKGPQPHSSSSKKLAVPARRSSVNLPVSNKKKNPKSNEKVHQHDRSLKSGDHAATNQHSNKAVRGNSEVPQSILSQATLKSVGCSSPASDSHMATVRPHKSTSQRVGSRGGVQDLPGQAKVQVVPQEMTSSPKHGLPNQLHHSKHKHVEPVANTAAQSFKKPMEDHRPASLLSPKPDQQKETNKPRRRSSTHASAKLARLSAQHEETRRMAEPPSKFSASHSGTLSPVKKTPNLMHSLNKSSPFGSPRKPNSLPMDRTKNIHSPKHSIKAMGASPTKSMSRQPEHQSKNTSRHIKKYRKILPKGTYHPSSK